MSDLINDRMLDFYEAATPAQRAFEGELARLYFTDDYMDGKIADASSEGDFSTENALRDMDDLLADSIEAALNGELKVVKKGAMWVYSGTAREARVSVNAREARVSHVSTNEARATNSNMKRKRKGDGSEAPGDATRASKATRSTRLVDGVTRT